MKKIVLFVLPIFFLLLTSCNQKEFDQFATGQRCQFKLVATYAPRWHEVYDDGPDWKELWDEEKYLMSYESLIPDEPGGLRTIVYHENSDNYDIFNFPAHGGIIDLNEGVHSLMLFNNDTEYILFNDIDKAAEATATTRSRSRSSYMGSPYVKTEANENTINPPDMLYARDGGSFEADIMADTLTLEYELRPLVYKYLVRYHFTAGLQYVVLARGAIAGMASSVYLTDGHTSSKCATLLYDVDVNESKQIVDPDKGEGMLYAVVMSFGAPGYPNEYYSRSDNTYGLNLEVRLKNGELLNFDSDITDQVKKQPRGGVIDVYGLEVTEPQASEGEGAFDVDVDGWGPHEDLTFM